MCTVRIYDVRNVIPRHGGVRLANDFDSRRTRSRWNQPAWPTLIVACALAQVGLAEEPVPQRSEQPKIAASAQDDSSCCAGLPESAFTLVRVGEHTKAQIRKTSPDYVFPSGRSYYAAYELADSPTPFRITLKSYLSWEVFYPCALLLDESRHQVRFVTAPFVHYVDPGFIERGHLQADIDVDPSLRARYLVLLTSDNALSNDHRRLPGANLGAPHWDRRTFVPTGVVEIALSPVKPER